MNIRIYYNEKKLKKPYLSLFNEYKKRLSPYCKIEFKNKYKNNSSIKDEYKILVSNQSDPIDSVELSKKISECALNSYSNIGFYFDDEKKGKDFDFALLLNKTTLELEISILVEQIYRSFTIINSKTYHK